MWEAKLFLRISSTKLCTESLWAGRSWAHLDSECTWIENRRVGLSVVDIDADMLRQCTHYNTKALGDILVRTTDLEITDPSQGCCCSRKQFAIDVKNVALIDSNGTLGEL